MATQPASTDIVSRTGAVINELKGLEGPLLPILHGIQHEFGYVPGEALPVIAEALKPGDVDIDGLRKRAAVLAERFPLYPNVTPFSG